MSDQRRPQTEPECPPRPGTPADQPKKPSGNCTAGTPTTPPPLADPKPCPPTDCDCPKGTGPEPTCLDQLIAAQTEEITKAEKAKNFKAELEGILAKAKTARTDYTRVKYDKLVKQWVEEDTSIAELIRRLVCALPCWKCVVECYICPLLNQIRDAEQRLYAGGVQYADVKTLYQLQFWLTRDKEAKERVFNRIKNVLAAWEKPAQTIEKVLADNQTLIESAAKLIGTDPGKAVYDVFFRLAPMHLAIAPTDDTQWKTRIAKEYTDLCPCDPNPDPDNCCGPNLAEQSVVRRLISPQPYLLDPALYMDLICCLVKERYEPAKKALSAAEAALVTTTNDIARYLAAIDNGFKSIEKDAKGAIPAQIDCCDFEEGDHDDDDHGHQSSAR